MSRSQKTALTLLGVVLLMVGLSFAAVPFYRWFCQTTGFGGTTATATAAPGRMLDRVITIRFDGSTAQHMPWQFRPVQRRMDLHIGETGLAFFEAYNPTERTIAGTASFNVTPDAAGGYFTKIECFCFTEQVLGPGERVEMPVSFFIDPDIVNDAEARHLQEMTLSYTFFETASPSERALSERSPGEWSSGEGGPNERAAGDPAAVPKTPAGSGPISPDN